MGTAPDRLRLDLATGTLTLPDGTPVPPHVPRHRLLPTLPGSWSVRTGAPPWRIHQSQVEEPCGRRCEVSLTFEGEQLRRIALRLLPSVGDAVGADAAAAAALHRVFAEDLVGATFARAAVFVWGTVRPVHDPRSDSSAVEIRLVAASYRTGRSRGSDTNRGT